MKKKSLFLSIIVFMIISVSPVSSAQLAGTYIGNFDQLPKNQTCNFKLSIMVKIEIQGTRVSGVIRNLSRSGRCKNAHVGSIAGTIDKEGNLINVAIRAKYANARDHGAYKIIGNVNKSLTLISRNSDYFPNTRFTLAKYASSPIATQKLESTSSTIPTNGSDTEDKIGAEFKKFDKNGRVNIQKTLANKGFYNSSIDGLYGKRTNKAIKAHLREQDVDASSKVGITNALRKLAIVPKIQCAECADADNTPINPVQIVIDEINADILALLVVHISQDEVSELEAERDDKFKKFRELATQLVALEQSRGSPETKEALINRNTSLELTIEDIEARSFLLEKQIRDLNSVLVDNAGIIKDIDILNRHLADLSAQKVNFQSVQDERNSKLLGMEALIIQKEFEVKKIEAQISNLDIQIEAAASTAGTLVKEVVQLKEEINETKERTNALEASVSEAKVSISNANSNIGQKSQEVSKLNAELNKKVAESQVLSNLVNTLSPQADAAETTVANMRSSLETEFVPIAQFQEKAAILNDLTQVVTERTTFIQELRSDLASIEQEEQLFIKMCMADVQCKSAMGERLGVKQ